MPTKDLAASSALPSSRSQNRTVPAIAGGMLLLSGAAALIFQVLWIKQLSIVTGVDIYAVSTGVSAFFIGMAAGSLVIGRLIDRSRRPLRLYALFEALVAVLGLAVTVCLSRIAPLFVSLEQVTPLAAWGLLIGLVATPAFLMGGTLPVVVSSLASAPGGVGVKGGRLYAANTLGAIVGCLAVPFALIPALGVTGTAFAAAGFAIAAAMLALSLKSFSHASSPQPLSATDPKHGSILALVLYAIAGAVALGYEVVWSQAVVQFISTRSFAFSIVLATYLLGLAGGSFLLSRRADRTIDPWGLFGLLISAAGLLALAEIALLGPWLISLQSLAETWVVEGTGSLFAGMCARFLVASLTIVFGPTLLLGAAFPVVLRLAVDTRHAGRDTGRVLAFNTLGGILGTLVTGFVLVPALGIVTSLGILASIAAAIGIVAAYEGSGRNRFKALVLTAGAAIVVLTVATPKDHLADLLNRTRGEGTIVSYDEGLGATVAVIEQGKSDRRFKRLYIQGVSNTGDAMPSLRYMRLQALLPLIIQNEQPKSALVIGLGTGITAGSLLAYPGLERRVVAELLPAVVEASAHFKGNFNAAKDSRLEVRLRDGRRELLASDERYDLITLEPPPPSAAGVVNLYSSDFYRLARERLTANGSVAQWLPIATQNDEDTRSLVRSFLDVFPHVTLWTTELHEMLLIGSLAPQSLDADKIARRFDDPVLAAALAEIGVRGAADLLATWMMDRAGLEHYAGNALAVTDDHPRIEYGTWVRSDEIQRTLPALIAERTELPVKVADPDFEKLVSKSHNQLMLFYQASLNAYAGYRDEWARDMDLLQRTDPKNGYFNWFVAKADD